MPSAILGPPLITKECILNAIRDSIPIEQILRNYLDETTEEDITVTEEIIKKPEPVASIKPNESTEKALSSDVNVDTKQKIHSL